MHPELSRPDRLVQTAYLSVPIETAWLLLTEPAELMRWRGGDLLRVESGRAQGESLVLHYRNNEVPYVQIGKILCWEPPYQLSYSYWHSQAGLSNQPHQLVNLVFQLTALPGNKTMLYLTQTGFHEPATFEQSDLTWRTALARLENLHAVVQ